MPLLPRALFLAASLSFCASAAACGSTSSQPAPQPCVCTCPQCEGPGNGATIQGSPASLTLLDSAARKKNHEDGAGCLADLDQAAIVDPAGATRQELLRAQCEMLIGQCQAGKTRIARWQIDQMAATPDAAQRFAEAMASISCRGGDSSARDQFMSATQQLIDGAHVSRRDPAFCRAAIDTIVRLSPQVQPRDPGDTQIDGVKKSLWVHAANCLGHAGDCVGARQAFRDHFPADTLPADPATREKVLNETFTASVKWCQ